MCYDLCRNNLELFLLANVDICCHKLLCVLVLYVPLFFFFCFLFSSSVVYPLVLSSASLLYILLPCLHSYQSLLSSSASLFATHPLECSQFYFNRPYSLFHGVYLRSTFFSCTPSGHNCIKSEASSRPQHFALFHLTTRLFLHDFLKFLKPITLPVQLLVSRRLDYFCTFLCLWQNHYGKPYFNFRRNPS